MYMYLSVFYNESFIKILLFDGQAKINKIFMQFNCLIFPDDDGHKIA